MKNYKFYYFGLLLFCGVVSTGCTSATKKGNMASTFEIKPAETGYAAVNGLKMYYEIYGEGKPLVLIHGGGSTIQTSFARVIPLFAAHRMVIAVELQAHGHTRDINRPLTFEQDADDVAALMDILNIPQADFFGFSNGANTAMQIAIRHPKLVRKLIAGSGFYKRAGMQPQFWEFMKNADISNMPQPLKTAYLDITQDEQGLLAMHNRDRDRMVNFKDWTEADIKKITAPTLLIFADKDVMTLEHAVEMYHLLPNGALVVLPGMHGTYIGEIMTFKKGDQQPARTAGLVEDFLNQP